MYVMNLETLKYIYLMSNNENSRWLILVLVIILIVGYVHFSNKVENLEQKIRDKEVIIDTVYTQPMNTGIHKPVFTPKDGVLMPKVVYRDTGSTVIQYDTIREPFDTMGFLTDYLSIKTYIDSIKSQDVEIKVFDTLQKNSIFARSYTVKNLRNEDFFKTRKLYVSGDIGYNQGLLFGPSVTYTDKSNSIFRGSYLFNDYGSPIILFSYGKKIELKK